MSDSFRHPWDLANLAELSSELGSDPLLIQGPGGNTSIKDGDTLWIKASGTLLAEALSRDIFVPVDLPRLREALAGSVEAADKAGDFARGGATLRPSIETSLHAVLPQRVVVHVHCVNTIAAAIRADAEKVLTERLEGFDWSLVPYARPGARLAVAVRERLGERTDVIILANHGLIVAAETVQEAADLLERVVDALRCPEQGRLAADMDALGELAGEGWIVPEAGDPVHQLALAPLRLEQASKGSLYPDHVIFCGEAVAILEEGGTPPPAQDSPAILLAPGKGALLRADASSGAKALASCLGDVLLRVEEGAELSYLTRADHGDLLGWDAEKYRQKLDS